MGLSNLQTKIIAGAFDLRSSTIDTLITPIDRVFSLSVDTVIDKDTIELIKKKGYSRIPVYYGENKTFILGLLIVKSLLGIDIDEPKSLKEMSKEGSCVIKTPIYASPQATVGQMLNIFKEGSAHLAIVCEDPERLVNDANIMLEEIKQGKDQQLATTVHNIFGITTLEKIIEQIINMQILDEKDMDKRLRNPSGHFSITVNEESIHNLNDLTEMINDTNLREN